MVCSKEDWAVFWCSLLSPLRLGEIPQRRRERYFRQLSQEDRLLPDGQRKRVSVRTLRRWWRRLKEEGVPGLYRRPRNDRGNAKIYHAKALQLACAQLNIRLLHRPPRDPPAGGLIERVIQTCQMQLEAEVRAGEVLTLDDLNRVLAAWLDVAYHQEVHRETGQTPHERYHQEPRLLRQVDLGTVLSFFHQRVPRTVNEDFSDVRLDGLFFAVDPTFRDDRVIVQYDPFSPLEEVQLYTPAGTYLGRGRRYQREKGSHPQPVPGPPAGPIAPHYLDALRAEHAARQEQRRSLGIDYHSARQRNVWSVPSFARV